MNNNSGLGVKDLLRFLVQPPVAVMLWAYWSGASVGIWQSVKWGLVTSVGMAVEQGLYGDSAYLGLNPSAGNPIQMNKAALGPVGSVGLPSNLPGVLKSNRRTY